MLGTKVAAKASMQSDECVPSPFLELSSHISPAPLKLTLVALPRQLNATKSSVEVLLEVSPVILKVKF